MADEASHRLARQVVAKLCQPLGWQGIQNGACDVLADLLKRYVTSLGRISAAYASNASRTDVIPDDLTYAFEEIGISLDDLLVYARLVDSTPAVPNLPGYPLPRSSAHVYSPLPTTPSAARSRPSLSEEDEEGEDDHDDIIPPYLPPLPSKKSDKDEDDVESGVHESVEREEAMDISESFTTPSDPQRGLPQMFRSRSRLSSEISEDGGGGGSRRGSFSDASATVPTTETPPASVVATEISENTRESEITPGGSAPRSGITPKPPLVSKPRLLLDQAENDETDLTEQSVEQSVTAGLGEEGSGNNAMSIDEQAMDTLEQSEEEGEEGEKKNKQKEKEKEEEDKQKHKEKEEEEEEEEEEKKEEKKVKKEKATKDEKIEKKKRKKRKKDEQNMSSRPPPLNIYEEQPGSPILPHLDPAIKHSLPLLSPLHPTPTKPLPPTRITEPPLQIVPTAAESKSKAVGGATKSLSHAVEDGTITAAGSDLLEVSNNREDSIPRSPHSSDQEDDHILDSGGAISNQTRSDLNPASRDIDSSIDDTVDTGQRDSNDSRVNIDSPLIKPGTLSDDELISPNEEEEKEGEKETLLQAAFTKPPPSFPSIPSSREDTPTSPAHSSQATPTNLGDAARTAEEVEGDEAAEEEEVGGGEVDNESLVSSTSSKVSVTNFDDVPDALVEKEEDEEEVKFQITQRETFPPPQDSVPDEQSLFRSREVSVANINMEGGGEGGVASILHGNEEEMDLPDIDQQLELTDSDDDSSSSGSSSDSDIEPVGVASEDTGSKVKLALGDSRSKVEMFLEPLRVKVRSSSHSLASTPSVSPSPSPIPGLHSSLGPHSIPEMESESARFSRSAFTTSTTMDMNEHKNLSFEDFHGFEEKLVVTISRDLVVLMRDGGGGVGRGGGGRLGRGRGRGRGGRRERKKKDAASRGASGGSGGVSLKNNDSQKKKKEKQSLVQRTTIPKDRIKTEPPPSSLLISIPRSILTHELPLTTTSDLVSDTLYNEDEEDDDVIVTQSSAERGRTAETLPLPRSKGVAGGTWRRRELDISEIGLVPPPPLPAPPPAPPAAPPTAPTSLDILQVKVIPQPSSSSSGDSDTESEYSSHSSLSHPPPLHSLPPPPPPTAPPAAAAVATTPSPTPSPWQQPIRSEDEESTSSSVTGGSTGLKLKLKISKSLLQSMPSKHEKKQQKKRALSTFPTDTMATTSSRGHNRKRGKSSKSSQRGGGGGSSSSRKSGSNIPQINLPKLELPALSSSSWRQTTPTERAETGLYPGQQQQQQLKVPGVAVSPGGEVWFCPQCSKPDDGSPMIGCDGSCEGWYHWYCVGITQAPPENESWYCPTCASHKGKKKSRKRRH